VGTKKGDGVRTWEKRENRYVNGVKMWVRVEENQNSEKTVAQREGGTGAARRWAIRLPKGKTGD